jgi:hypothetical protein
MCSALHMSEVVIALFNNGGHAMPFDGSNYGSEVLRILRRARDRIANGQWVQGRLITREPHDVYHYCMLGSIVCNEMALRIVTVTRMLRDYGTWSGTRAVPIYAAE